MYIPTWITISSAWVCLSILCCIRQNRVDNSEGWLPVLAVFFSPLFFIGAIIRQVIIEDWK